MARHTGTVSDHLFAFKKFSRHNVAIVDAFIASKLDIDLSLFDAVVFHYSIVISNPEHISEEFAGRLSAFRGKKLLFIQDEFRWVDRTAEAAKELGIGVVFTVLNRDVVRKIYRDPYFDDVRFEHTLTGFVPEALVGMRVPDYEARPVDVCYRARKLPAWCGSFALQKWQIGERFKTDAARYGLVCDIATSEDTRIYGQAWLDFISNSKAGLGTESGASFVDYTGEVYAAVNEYTELHPDASFETLKEMFLEGRDGDVVIHVISPRCFEAAALRTLLIMYPGEYSGILEPGRHYVPLAPDHSNMEEVVDVLRDPESAARIVKNAYEEIACSGLWSYASFITHFDRVIDEEVIPQFSGRRKAPSALPARDAMAKIEAEGARKSRVRSAKLALLSGSANFVRGVLPSSAARALINTGKRVRAALQSAVK